jgi:hypothetical protein
VELKAGARATNLSLRAPLAGKQRLLPPELELLRHLVAREQPVSPLPVAVVPKELGWQPRLAFSEQALRLERPAAVLLLAAELAEQRALPGRSFQEARAHTSRKSGCPRDFHARRICTELSRDWVPWVGRSP